MDTSIMDLPMSPSKAVEVCQPPFICHFSDFEVVHMIAHVLLRGLAAACVHNTKGDPFKSPASLAPDVKKEMLDHLTGRCMTYDSMLEPQEEYAFEGDAPTRIISGFLDEFASSKRNIISWLSGWQPTDRQDNRVDTFLQEMETNKFWGLSEREAVAEGLLRNVDLGKEFHCDMGFDTPEELAEHQKQCRFLPVNCPNVGCKSLFCVVYAEKHDFQCPFKILPCAQKCSESIMRNEMYRHCTTICPMKEVNCPFFQAGCQTFFPQHATEKHLSEFIHSHMMCIVQILYKQEESVEDLKKRVLLLEKSQTLTERSEALDVRSLNLAIKEQEAKMKKLENNMLKFSQSSK